MYKIAHKTELDKIAHLPKEVFAIAETTVTVLDREYGDNRDINNEDGGYVVILEEDDSFDMLKQIGLDIESLYPEYSEKIPTDTVTYTYSMISFNNEFSVSLLMPLSLAEPIDGFLE